jgi:hypothetical protein
MATSVVSATNVLFTTNGSTIAARATATADTVTFVGASSAKVLLAGIASPSNNDDAATKQYVDSVAAGLSWKQAVVATTTVAGTLATSFQNTSVIDGVTLVTGERILVKDQASAIENGIYVVTTGTPTRATDMAVGAEVSGTAVFVDEGTINTGSGFVCTSTIALDVVGTDALTFTQFTGIGSVIAGAAMTKTGNTLDVAVDDSTVEVTADALNVKDAGITNAKLANASVTVTAGDGLQTGGAVALGAAVTLDVDTTVIRTTTAQSMAGVKTFTATAELDAGLNVAVDSQSITVGAGADVTLVHNGTDSTLTSATGNFTLDNTAATGQTAMQLGTDTTATSFAVKNNSAAVAMQVFGDSTMTLAGVTSVTDTTQSTVSTNGCLVISGGVGVAKDVNVAGDHYALSHTATSDKRLKTNIAELTDPLTTVNLIEGRSFNWNSAPDGSTQYGVMAQQLEGIGLADVVRTNSAGFKGVNYNALVPFLVEAIKSLTQKVAALEERVCR